MQFFLAAAALIGAVSAGYQGNVTYTTEVVTAYTTFCPEPTVISFEDKTYTITEATTITISDCPTGCTVVKPVYTTPVHECGGHGKGKGGYGCGGYGNHTTGVAPTGSYTPSGSVVEPTPESTVVPAGAGRVAALSGAGLAGLLALAAAL